MHLESDQSMWTFSISPRGGSPRRVGCALALLGSLQPVCAGAQAAQYASQVPPAAAAAEPAPPVSEASEALSLDQAVQRALEYTRQIQNSGRQVLANQQQLFAARTERLPRFGLGFLGQYRLSSGSDSQFEALPSVGLLPNFVTGSRASGLFVAGLMQPVFGLKKIGLNVQLRETAVASAHEEVRLQQQDVRATVKQLYYDLIEIRSALGANAESVRYYRELERTVADRVQQQSALQADLLEVQARRTAQEHETVLLGNRYAAAQEQLNDLMGRDVRTPFRVTAVADVGPPPGDRAALQALALQRRPEVRQSMLAVREARLQEQVARAEYIPTLSVGLQYFHFTRELPFNNDVSVGLLFIWEPFDWGRRRDQIRAQSIVVQERQTSLEGRRAQIVMDLNTQLRSLEEARDQLGVTRSSQEAARERVRVNLDRYAQKTVLLSDVLQAQSALAQANTQNQEALSSYLKAVADLSRAIGENDRP
jgi:outer membrane protein TolC